MNTTKFSSEKWKILKDVKKQIERYDNKSTILLTLASLVFGISSSIFAFKNIDFRSAIGTAFVVIYSIVIFFLVMEIIFILLVIFPRTKNSLSNSCLYYGDIALMDRQNFAKVLNNDLNADLENQIFINSQICRRKHSWLNKSFIIFIIFLCFIICCFILGVCI